MADPLTEDERVLEDGVELRIRSEEWSDVEFYRSNTDGEINIEITDSFQTWLTVEQARALRDWLIKVLQ